MSRSSFQTTNRASSAPWVVGVRSTYFRSINSTSLTTDIIQLIRQGYFRVLRGKFKAFFSFISNNIINNGRFISIRITNSKIDRGAPLVGHGRGDFFYPLTVGPYASCTQEIFWRPCLAILSLHVGSTASRFFWSALQIDFES